LPERLARLPARGLPPRLGRCALRVLFEETSPFGARQELVGVLPGLDAVKEVAPRLPMVPAHEDRPRTHRRGSARHVKNVPGRPKTDRLDCRWLQKLHSSGLLAPSFRPPEAICQLRSLLRHRGNLVPLSAKHIQPMHKSLDQMHLHLHHVMSDVTGVTGLRIIGAIVAGERDPRTLATYRYYRIQSSEDTIAKALEGDYRPEYVCTLPSKPINSYC